jgi:ABC-type branched-subunit amino acid transport system substrate-binding protein
MEHTIPPPARFFSHIAQLWIVCILLLAPSARAQETAHRPEIVLGMSTALTGPTASLGLNMRIGVVACIEERNRAGGVHGRMLRLVALDDGYEPARTIPNMRRLIDEEKVLAIVGNVGTPTAIAAAPIACAARTPFFGAYTGAGILRRTPPDRYVINYRASYAEETGAIVDALIDKARLKPGEIVFFTQRDAYGDSGFAGGVAALKRHGLQDESAVTHVRYERNTAIVENALADLLLLDPPPRAVIMVGAYAPCAALIRLARQNDLHALFINVSFVGSESLAAELGSSGDGIVISQVVPHFDADLPVIRDYRAALSASSPGAQPTFGSLEGYISTRILLRALDSIQGEPGRESLIDALEAQGKFDIGLGEQLELGKFRHQACHHVWPTMLRGGRVIPITWQDLADENGGPHD